MLQGSLVSARKLTLFVHPKKEESHSSHGFLGNLSFKAAQTLPSPPWCIPLGVPLLTFSLGQYKVIHQEREKVLHFPYFVAGAAVIFHWHKRVTLHSQGTSSWLLSWDRKRWQEIAVFVPHFRPAGDFAHYSPWAGVTTVLSPKQLSKSVCDELQCLVPSSTSHFLVSSPVSGPS